MTTTITVGGNVVTPLEGSLQITSRVDDKDSATFVVDDPSGTQTYQQNQTVTIVDSTLGNMFSGTVYKPTATRLMPSAYQRWTIQCRNQWTNATKKASKKRYKKRRGKGYAAGAVAADQIQRYIAPDGVSGNFSLSWTEQQNEWSNATLSNTVAATNLTNGNPSGGNLELASGGTQVTATGTGSGFTLVNGLLLTGYASSGYSAAYTNRQIWSGSQSITSTSDAFLYDVWISSDSPAIKAGADFICSDGTIFSASSATDRQFLGPSTGTDLSGLANDQWYTRVFSLPAALVGKTLVSVLVGFNSANAGQYTAYFRRIEYQISGGGTITFFGDSSTLQSNIQINNLGYTNVSLTQVRVENKTATTTHSGLSIGAAGIVQSSQMTWSVNLPSGCTGTRETSIDGGASWQTITEGSSVPNLVPGMVVTGKSVQYRDTFTIGKDPTVNIGFGGATLVVNPSYVSTKSDLVTTYTTANDFNTGTLTNLMTVGSGTTPAITLNGVQRNWDDGFFSNQPQFGTNSPFQQVENKQFVLQTGTGTDARSQLQFAGQWQNFTAEVDVSCYSTGSNAAGFVYRTTGWQNNNDTYAYTIMLSQTQLIFGRGTNSGAGAGSFTSIATATVALSANSVHRLKAVINGSTHQFYVDNVLLITSTDATYGAAGYLGLRIFNGTGSTQSAAFDNFGVAATLSGTWQSSSINIAGPGTYGNSMVQWDIDGIPDSTCSITAQTSIDGGSTFQSVTNGGAISGLTAGQSLTGKTLILKLTLTASNAPVVPTLNGVTAWIMGQYTSTGTRSNAPLGNDVFVRANQSGFGISTDQQAYTKQGSATIAIASNAGTITGTGLTDIQLGSSTVTDQSMTSQFKVGNVASLYGVDARYTNSSGTITTYRAYVQSGNFVLDKRVSGTVTSLQTVAFALSTGTNYKMRLVCQGTTIQARIWLASAQEPTTWQLSQTDSSIASGGSALSANMTTGDTATVNAYFATLWPDPTQYLTNAGRAINSIADHNSNIPTNTRVDILTSIDGGATYQPVANAGDYIPTISTAAHYTAVRALSGLQAFYRFNEQSNAIAYDSSNNANSATFHGGITFGQPGPFQGVNEVNDTAVLLDGSTGYISLPTALNGNGYTALSVGGWFNLSTGTLGSFTNIASAGTAAAHTGYQIYWSSTTNLIFFAGNGTTSTSTAYATTATAGVWVHVVGTFDGSNIKIYVNGTLRTTTPLTGTISATQTPIIGATTSLSSFFPGSVAGWFITNADIGQSGVTAIYNAGTQATQSTYSDTFTSNTSTSYTQTHATGGVNATWTWDTANSRIIAVGGTNAQLIYNTFTASDVDILADFLQSENGGLVWRWTNASNFYALVVKDNFASTNPNTLTLNKMSGGTMTPLATASITWQMVVGGVTVSQVHHRVRVTMLGGVITVYFDGTQVLTYTDGSPLASGQWGLRNDTGTSYCYLWSMTPQAPDISGKAIYTKHVLTSNDPTATPQITDAHTMVSDSTFGLGTTIPSLDANQKYLSDNIDTLNTTSNYWYTINFNKQVTFTARNAQNAPFILQSGDVQIASHSVEYSADLYRNRQTLTGVYQTSTYTEIKTGDGSTRTWNVANPIASGPPTITLNGLPATVGVLNVDTGRQLYYQIGSTAITQDNSQTILTSGDSFTIAYTGTSAIDFTIDNTGQFPGTLAQSDIAALDKTTGVIEAIEDVSQKNMDVTAATTYANQLLQRYGTIARTFKFTTLHTGLTVGQNIPVFVPELNIFDSFFLVVEVKTSERYMNGAFTFVQNIVISEAATEASWVKLFNKIMRSV